jgi:N-acetylglucosaminyldiphosphoundecaprenol N-acetyl-beta-D-mannosaminyltransferase
MTSLEIPTVTVAGLRMANTRGVAISEVLCLAASARVRTSTDVHLVNAGSVYFGEQRPEVKEMFVKSSMLLPDGKSIQMASKLLGSKIPQVRGPWLFNELMSVGREHGLRHFLIGTTDETLKRLVAELERRYPGVQIVGSLSPPFRESTPGELAAQDDAVRASGANIVWLGMSSPKQDFEAQRLAQALPGLVLAVGAAFDFVAGTQKEAPRWVQKSGFEWLFRLLSNPRRLWKRYLLGNLVFIGAVVKHRRERFSKDGQPRHTMP